MYNQKITKIASIVIGFIIAILLFVMGFKFIQNTFIRAEDITPRDVVVTDVAQNSVKITWATGIETQGVVEYGTTPTALNFFAPETQKTTSHSVDLTLLSPTTTYYFQIRVGDKKFDNGGVPWSFTTKGAGTTQPDKPTSTPTQPPTPTPPAGGSTCNETDCQKIKEKIGKGCSARDYSLCIAKPTPTLIVAPKITITPTDTPTATPSASPSP